MQTVVPYRGLTSKLLAAADGEIFDVSTSTPSSLGSGFTSDRWQTANHSTKLILVNGEDAPQVYDGSTLAAANFTGSPGGFVAADMWSVATFKGRAFYWKEASQSCWYANAGAYQGVLAEYNMASVLQSGGTLVMVVTWTLDSGSGVDDLAVFIFSTGETLVYSGSDPGDVADWSLIGRFQIGEPLGPRAHAKTGGTEIILTRDGYLDISAALKDGRYSEKSAYSAKIIRASKSAPAQYGNFDGWEAVLYPAGQLFVVNVPTSEATAFQHVRETSSGGWCEFTGWNALTFCVHDDRLYFGDADGNVCLADEGATDGGDYIDCWGIPAFNALGNRSRRKQLTAATVVSSFTRPAAYAYDGLADFNTALRTAIVEDTATDGSSWDTADWDTAEWATSGQLSAEEGSRTGWKNCSAIGYTITLSVRLRQRSQVVNWYSTNLQYRNAGAF